MRFDHMEGVSHKVLKSYFRNIMKWTNKTKMPGQKGSA